MSRCLSVAIGTSVLCCLQGCDSAPNTPKLPSDVERLPSATVIIDPVALELTRAAEDGNIAEIDRLVTAGANVNELGRYDVTPLFRVLVSQNKAGYRRLLELGANPNIRHIRGVAVMHKASNQEDPFWLDQALKRGGDPNILDTGNPFTKGIPPLFYAINDLRTTQAELLLKAGADPKYVDPEGITSLQLACSRGAFDIVCMLLEAGADYPKGDVVAFINECPLEFVREGQRKWHRRAVELLAAKKK